MRLREKSHVLPAAGLHYPGRLGMEQEPGSCPSRSCSTSCQLAALCSTLTSQEHLPIKLLYLFFKNYLQFAII
ncbi:hypothetical protein AGIG_G4824 [Arapaima gigas]